MKAPGVRDDELKKVEDFRGPRKLVRELSAPPPWDGEVGPLERGFTSATSLEDCKGWVVGLYNELAELP